MTDMAKKKAEFVARCMNNPNMVAQMKDQTSMKKVETEPAESAQHEGYREPPPPPRNPKSRKGAGWDDFDKQDDEPKAKPRLTLQINTAGSAEPAKPITKAEMISLNKESPGNRPRLRSCSESPRNRARAETAASMVSIAPDFGYDDDPDDWTKLVDKMHERELVDKVHVSEPDEDPDDWLKIVDRMNEAPAPSDSKAVPMASMVSSGSQSSASKPQPMASMQPSIREFSFGLQAPLQLSQGSRENPVSNMQANAPTGTGAASSKQGPPVPPPAPVMLSGPPPVVPTSEVVPTSFLEGGSAIETKSLLSRDGNRQARVVHLDCGDEVALCAVLMNLQRKGQDLKSIRCSSRPSNLAALTAFLASTDKPSSRTTLLDRLAIIEPFYEKSIQKDNTEDPVINEAEVSALCSVLASGNRDRVAELHLGGVHAARTAFLVEQLRRVLVYTSVLCNLAIHDISINFAMLAPVVTQWCHVPPGSTSVRYRSLELQRCSFRGSRGFCTFADALRDCPTLTSLELSTCGLTSDCAIALSQAMMKIPVLQKLLLRGNYISDNGAMAFARCLTSKACSTLVELNLEFNEIGYVGISALRQAGDKLLSTADAHLSRLLIDGNPGATATGTNADPGFESAARIAAGIESYPARASNVPDSFRHARMLGHNAAGSQPDELRSNGVSPLALQQFAANILARHAAGCPGGLRVMVTGSPGYAYQDYSIGSMVDREWAHLCTVMTEAGASIRALEIDVPLSLQNGAQSVAAGITGILRSAKVCEGCSGGLRTLRVKQNSCDAQCFLRAPLEGGFALEQLELQLSNCEPSWLGGAATALLRLPNLRELSLPCSGITSDGATSLAGALTAASSTLHSSSRPLQLRCLNLSRNAITDAGAWALASCLDVRPLLHGSLQTGGSSASSSVVAPLLVELDLSFNCIAAAGSAALLGTSRRRAQTDVPLSILLHGNAADANAGVPDMMPAMSSLSPDPLARYFPRSLQNLAAPDGQYALSPPLDNMSWPFDSLPGPFTSPRNSPRSRQLPRFPKDDDAALLNLLQMDQPVMHAPLHGVPPSNGRWLNSFIPRSSPRIHPAAFWRDWSLDPAPPCRWGHQPAYMPVAGW